MASRTPLIVNVDSIEVASAVISSLRSSARSQKRYQLQARNDDVIVENVEQLNSIIHRQRIVVEERNERQQRIIDAINSHGNSLHASSTLESPSSKPSPSIQRSVDKDASDDSDDEIGQPSASVFHNECKAEYNSDDDLLQEDDDMRELMAGFVAPVAPMGLQSSRRTAADELPPSPASRTTLSGSTRLKPLPAIKDVANASLKKGVIIKPGQAIRVKASSGKGRLS